MEDGSLVGNGSRKTASVDWYCARVRTNPIAEITHFASAFAGLQPLQNPVALRPGMATGFRNGPLRCSPRASIRPLPGVWRFASRIRQKAVLTSSPHSQYIIIVVLIQ